MDRDKDELICRLTNCWLQVLRLDRAGARCEEDPSYSWTRCARAWLDTQTGCRLDWTDNR